MYGGKRLDRPGKNYYRLPSKNIVANLIKFDGLDKASTNYDKTGTNFVYVHVFCYAVGFYMEPTIFTDVTDDMFIAKEESFGPVMIISQFEDGYVHQMIKSFPGLHSIPCPHSILCTHSILCPHSIL